MHRSFQWAFALSVSLLAGACSRAPNPQQKPAVAASADAPSDGLFAIAAREASAACGADAGALASERADFDGDGAPDLLINWSKAPCAASKPEVCTAAAGCVRAVWRLDATGPSRIYQGQAKAARIAPGTPATLVLDHAGAMCGRPPTEVCRVTYRWDARVRAMQEVAREIVAPRKA